MCGMEAYDGDIRCWCCGAAYDDPDGHRLYISKIEDMNTDDLLEYVKDMISERGAGFHRLGNYMVYAEPWTETCISETLNIDIADYDEKQDIIDKISEHVNTVISSELSNRGEVIKVIHHIYDYDEDVPFGWTIAIIKPKNEKEASPATENPESKPKNKKKRQWNRKT